MFLRTDTPPADAFAFARMGDTLVPATPRTLRAHVGARTFGDFGAVLLAERPASADLSDRVARLREIKGDATRGDIVRFEDFRTGPIQPHPDMTVDRAGCRIAMIVTTAVLGGWILVGLLVAYATGKL